MVNTLDIILGPMFSGKTSRLLKITEEIKNTNLMSKEETELIMIIKPDVDRRYEQSEEKHHIISHDGLRQECHIVSDLMKFISIIEDTVEKIKLRSIENLWIIIDEGQFFKNLRKFCEKLFELFGKLISVKIVVSGLDGDYQKKSIGDILSLIPICDTVVKLKGKCQYCNELSIMSQRTTSQKSQVLIGGGDLYKPTCRYHHNLSLKL
jgi:thymidine kinase